MIGNTNYLGKGIGAQILQEFVEFFRKEVDAKADTFLIDPATDNSRATRVYAKAGFTHIADFLMEGDVSGAGKQHHLLIKKYPPLVSLQLAELDQYSLVQNMARSYALSLSKDIDINADFDFKNYFTEESRKAYLIKSYSDIAGFVLVNKATFSKNSNLNIGEFFILDKYQRLSIGRQAAELLWSLLPGIWEVSVIPENISALTFWENIISKYTNNNFSKALQLVDFDAEQPQRVIYTLSTY